MRKTILVFGLLILFSSQFLKAQDVNNFTKLEAYGKIPDNLLEIANSNDKFKNEYEEKLRIQLKNYILSGKIVFGDTVSLYINNIVDRLLKDEKELRNEIKVYVVKSSLVNAFATSKGYLFITTGFIAQSTNEAELAFTIAHEIIHYSKKHGYSLKDDFDDIKDFLTYHSRSREQEFECDREGYTNYYLKAGYDKNSPMGVYDILQYSYLPFDEVKIGRDYFETPYYKFRDNYFLESVNPISSRENYIDTFSTHPNLKSRRMEMEKLIKENSQSEGKEYIQSKEAFDYIRTICRFETINQQIMEDNYIKSYYNSLILLEKHPDNKFLRTAKIASLYGISKVKTYGNYSRYLLTRKETEGELQFIANFFEKANKKEIALLALREIYFGMQKEETKYYTALFNDIIKDLSEDMKLSELNQFSDLRMDETPEADTAVKNDNNNKSKYDKIKDTKIVGHIKGFKTENYMLGDLKKDSVFVDKFVNVVYRNESKKAGDLINELKDEKKETKKIDKLIIFEPNTIVYNKYSEVKKSSETDERLALKFEKEIKTFATRNGITPIIMSSHIFDTSFSYQLRAKIHDFGMGLNKFGEIYYESRDMENYSEELGCDYLSFIVLRKQKKSDGNSMYKSIHTISSIIYAYPFLPISICQWIQSSYNGELNFMVYNLENNSFEHTNNISFTYENTKEFEKQALDVCFKEVGDKNSSYSNHGYLGRRFIFRAEANLLPAIMTPNRSGEKGVMKFDYSFNPNIEFVLNKDKSVGAGISWMKSNFELDENYIELFPDFGSVDVLTYSIYYKNYKAIAPLGYYYKLQFDYWTYKPNVIYGNFNYDLSIYIGTKYTDPGFGFGLRLEYGKVFFVNDYIQIGTGCSAGMAFKGWAGLGDFDITIPEEIEKTLRRKYFLGINLNVGILPF